MDPKKKKSKTKKQLHSSVSFQKCVLLVFTRDYSRIPYNGKSFSLACQEEWPPSLPYLLCNSPNKGYAIFLEIVYSISDVALSCVVFFMLEILLPSENWLLESWWSFYQKGKGVF